MKAVLLASSRLAFADFAKELSSELYPYEGAVGPDTYFGTSSIQGCSSLKPYPDVVPWQPTLEDVKAFCSSRTDCGGFFYWKNHGGTGFPFASYCLPHSFVAGTIDVSYLGFERRMYTEGCDLRVNVPEAVSAAYGGGSRMACVRHAAGLSAARDIAATKPGVSQRTTRPQPVTNIAGVWYKVGTEVFASSQAASAVSPDGLSHPMLTDAGVAYYMPGASHATRKQAVGPIDVDGYYPLYPTEVAAEAASVRGGGNGTAHAVGPAGSGTPYRWTSPPHDQTFWMPSTGAMQFTGDHVNPVNIDGYYPLYKTNAAAQKVSSNGLASSFGPESSAGQPLAWSTGEYRVYYMPAQGPALYYGNYVPEAASSQDVIAVASSLYVTALAPFAAAGLGPNQASAAMAIAVASGTSSRRLDTVDGRQGMAPFVEWKITT